jgi:type IX secretion system PorP/SprF family membrane protein
MKMNIYKLVVLCSVAVATSTEVKAQDPEFTQFYSNPLYLNPAFAGSKKCPRIVMNYRNQWPNISGSYITSSVAYDQRVEGLNGGLGFIVLQDNAAQTLKTLRASAIYAYSINVTRKFTLNLGAEATFFQKSLDWSKLTFGDMIDPRRGFVYQTNDVPRGGSVSGVDFSAGAVGYSELFYFGFAVHHLTEPNESLLRNDSDPNARLPMKFTGHVGAMIPMGGNGYTKSNTNISPNLLFRKQGTFTQVNMGLYVKSGVMTFGAWYRNKDAFIVSVGIDADNFRIGYSYDVTVSKLSLASGGSHEVSLGIVFPCKPKKKVFRTISCPSF